MISKIIDLSIDVHCKKCGEKFVYIPKFFRTTSHTYVIRKNDKIIHAGNGIFICLRCNKRIPEFN